MKYWLKPDSKTYDEFYWKFAGLINIRYLIYTKDIRNDGETTFCLHSIHGNVFVMWHRKKFVVTNFMKCSYKHKLLLATTKKIKDALSVTPVKITCYDKDGSVMRY